MSDQYGNFQGVPQTPAPAPYQQPPHGRLDKGYPAAAQKPRPGITVMLALAAILVLVALRIVDFFLAASIDSLDASSWRSLLFTIFYIACGCQVYLGRRSGSIVQTILSALAIAVNLTYLPDAIKAKEAIDLFAPKYSGTVNMVILLTIVSMVFSVIAIVLLWLPGTLQYYKETALYRQAQAGQVAPQFAVPQFPVQGQPQQPMPPQQGYIQQYGQQHPNQPPQYPQQ